MPSVSNGPTFSSVSFSDLILMPSTLLKIEKAEEKLNHCGKWMFFHFFKEFFLVDRCDDLFQEHQLLNNMNDKFSSYLVNYISISATLKTEINYPLTGPSRLNPC